MRLYCWKGVVVQRAKCSKPNSCKRAGEWVEGWRAYSDRFVGPLDLGRVLPAEPVADQLVGGGLQHVDGAALVALTGVRVADVGRAAVHAGARRADARHGQGAAERAVVGAAHAQVRVDEGGERRPEVLARVHAAAAEDRLPRDGAACNGQLDEQRAAYPSSTRSR